MSTEWDTRHIPTKEQVRIFLEKNIAEARAMNDTERADRLLDQLANLDETVAFIEQVLTP